MSSILKFSLIGVLLFPLTQCFALQQQSVPDSLSVSGKALRDSLIRSTEVHSCSGNKYLRQSIAPVSLATASLGILAFPALKYEIQEKMNWNKEEKVVLYDDQLRYVPMAVLPVLTLIGVDGKHKLLEQVALGGAAYIFADFIVYRTKLATRVTRPAPSTSTESFPSQHTSIAFVSATLLHREFGHISPWISVAGYATAAWVGYSRVARNRHFLTDVLMGAAVGTLSTNATYWLYDYLEPKLKNWFSIAPAITPEGFEVQLCYRF